MAATENPQAPFIPPLKHVYRTLDELRALDESTVGFELVDYTPQASRMLWLNETAQKVVFHRPFEDIAKFDLNNGLSKALRDHSDFLWKTVQCDRETYSEVKTVYMGGTPKTYNIMHRPLSIVLPDCDEPQTVILNQWQPMEDYTPEQQQWRLGAELFLQVDIKILCFDVKSLEVRFQNPKSSAFYLACNRTIERFQDWMETFDVDDPSVELADAAEMKTNLEQFVRDLKIGVDPVAFECKSRCMELRGTSVTSGSPGESGGERDVWHRVRCSPCMDPLDGRTLVLVQEFDITELKEIEHHLVKEQEDMEQFFACVSHELRSPLNGIIGLASALVADPACNARLSKTVKLIQSSGQRMVSLVSDIVDSAALKRRQLLIKHESVNVAEVAAMVCEVLSPIVTRKVKLVNQIGEAFPCIVGDTGRISQILTNLVSNAIKFTHEGCIRVSAEEEGNAVVLSVSDTGIGIPADKLEFLWDAFKQVDRATTRRYGGNGLGLFLVKDLVNAHNGTVAVTSKHEGPDRGSTFAIRLPKSQEQEPETPASHPALSRARSRDPASTPSASPRSAIVEPGATSIPPFLASRRARHPSWKGKGKVRSFKDGPEGPSSPAHSDTGSRSLPSRSLPGRKEWQTGASFRHTKGSFRGLADIAGEDGAPATVAALQGQVEALALDLETERKRHQEVHAEVQEARTRADALALQVEAERERAARLEKAVKELKAALEDRTELLQAEAKRRGGGEGEAGEGEKAPWHPKMWVNQGSFRGSFAVDRHLGAGFLHQGSFRDVTALAGGKGTAGALQPSAHVSPPVEQRVSTPSPLKGRPPPRRASDAGSDASEASRTGARQRSRLPSRESVHSHSDLHGQLEVLAVDDDPVNQMVMEALLQSNGFKVTSAMDGQEALDLLKTRNFLPDIVLLDCEMPIKSGFEVCEELRRDYPENLPIIMISANSDEDNIVKGFKVGSNDYVKKPFNRYEVLARIETQIRLRDMWRMEVEAMAATTEAVRSNELLDKILPFHVAERLKLGQTMVSDSLDQVTILFSDVVGFTNMASRIQTSDLIMLLNDMFTKFDRLVDKHGVYKVETIGDAYMVAAGHENSSREDHSARVFNMAKDMMAACGTVELPEGVSELQIRIGIHSGPAYAGVVGEKCPRYCFFGDTVNTASRMESNGFPMCIHVSEATKRLLEDVPEGWVEFGARHIKGKGEMTTYLACTGAWREALAKRDSVGGLSPPLRQGRRATGITRPMSHEALSLLDSPEGEEGAAPPHCSPGNGARRADAEIRTPPPECEVDAEHTLEQGRGAGNAALQLSQAAGARQQQDQRTPRRAERAHAAEAEPSVKTNGYRNGHVSRPGSGYNHRHSPLEAPHVSGHRSTGAAGSAEPQNGVGVGIWHAAEGGGGGNLKEVVLHRMLQHETLRREAAEKRELLSSAMLRQREANTISLLEQLTNGR